MITQDRLDELDRLESQVATVIKRPTWYNLAEKYDTVNSFVVGLSEAGLDKETIYNYLDELEQCAKREKNAFEERLKAFKNLFNK